MSPIFKPQSIRLGELYHARRLITVPIFATSGNGREEGNSRTSHKFQNIGVSRDSTIIILVSVGLVTGSPNLFSISHASGKGIFQCVETRRYLPVLVLETLVTRKSSNAQRECKSALAAKVISAHLHLERSELCRGSNSVWLERQVAINQDYDVRAENPF